MRRSQSLIGLVGLILLFFGLASFLLLGELGAYQILHLVGGIGLLGWFLFASFREVQKLYTFIGAYIFPTLAVVLIVFNSRGAWVGQRFKNHPVTIGILASVLAFFTWMALNIDT